MKQRYIELPDTWDELTESDWRELLKIRQKVVAHGGRYSELDILTETARMLLKNRGVKLQLNNANYIRIAMELLPEGFKVKGLRVEYRVAAKLGDVLLPAVYRIDNGIIVSLSIGTEVSAIIEFEQG